VKDAQSGKTTIQGLFDNVFAPGVPAFKADMAVFIRIKVADNAAPLSPRLEFIHPSGLKNPMPDLPAVNVGSNRIADAIINMQGVVFPEFGEYSIDLLLNNICVAKHPLTVQRRGVQSDGSQQIH
jgi:uncharacterized protein DUF6941